MAPVHVIIVAGGSGTRFGTELPKQFVEIAGRPVLLRALDSIRRALPGAAVTVVLPRGREDYFIDLCRSHATSAPAVVCGGGTRWESVRNGLATVADDTDVVMVHDGARPFPSRSLIDGLLCALGDGADGAVPAVEVTDSLRRSTDGGRTSTAVDRAQLRAVQTPQAFRTVLLRRAYGLPYRETFTDDASVMEAAGYTDIRLTPGSPSNLKVTHPTDMAVAEAFIAAGLV